MKPNWKDAPEWAQWLAMDDNWQWFWYEKKPRLGNGWWKIMGGKGSKAILCDGAKCSTDTLEQRPEQ